MAKRALLVGCNYPDSDAPLNGCVNDVNRFRKVLRTRFGFDDIRTLVDTDENSIQPTHVNIRAQLTDLITGAQPGDVLLFQFSGHGLRMPPEAGESDETGWDEAIMPCDMNPLTDDDFRELVEQIPAGATFTFIADSCHSGGLIDETKEQIGDAEDIREQSLLESGGSNKEISVEQLASTLSRRYGHPVAMEVGNIRTTLFDIFGKEASLTVKKFENLVMQKIKNEQDEDGLVGTINSLAVEFLQQKLAEDPESYLMPAQNAGVYRSRSLRTAAAAADVGILLSGCQSYELSSDQSPEGGEAYGAFTKAIETVLSYSEAPLSNREMILAARKWLQSEGLTQHPCLYCSDDNADAPFICDYTEGEETRT